ncbi:MAG: DUF6807 family protein [Planctomycetota bacterium]
MFLLCGACFAGDALIAKADSPVTEAKQPMGRLEQSDGRITLIQNGKPVLTYNVTAPPLPEGIDAACYRSGCLHPVLTPAGAVVTGMNSPDHAHQNGIFSAWVKTRLEGRRVDFWNMHNRTGRVDHEKIVQTNNDKNAPGFVVQLLHRAKPAGQQSTDRSSATSKTDPAGYDPSNWVNVLRDTWTVTLRPSNEPVHRFDLTFHQVAMNGQTLTIDKHIYGGIGIRGRRDWLLPQNATQDDPNSNVRMGIDSGAGRLAGNHQTARWAFLSGPVPVGAVSGNAVSGGAAQERDQRFKKVEDMPANSSASVIVLSHPDNFRAPQTVRLHPRMPYFCFAPCVTQGFQIDQQNPYTGRYRFLVVDGRPSTDWVNKQWRQFANQH